MNPADQHALREALARWLKDANPSWFDTTCADLANALIAGPLAPYLAAEAERDAIAKRDAHEFALRSEAPGDPWEMVRHLEEQCRLFIRERDEWKAVADRDRAARLAAEAENTRLKETVEAARAALKPFARIDFPGIHDPALADGAGLFVDYENDTPDLRVGHLRAARSVLATIPPKEHP